MRRDRERHLQNPFENGRMSNDILACNSELKEIVFDAADSISFSPPDQSGTEDALEMVRQLYCLLNETHTKDPYISAMICLNVVYRYRNLEDFATYGIYGFADIYRLREDQIRAVCKYSHSADSADFIRYNGIKLEGRSDVVHFLYWLFHGEKSECAYIIYLDSEMKVVGSYKKSGYKSKVHLDPSDVRLHMPYAEELFYIIAHNHIREFSEPSDDDIRTTVIFAVSASNNYCKLIDSVIVHGHTVYSIMYKRRDYYDTRTDLGKAKGDNIEHGPDLL